VIIIVAFSKMPDDGVQQVYHLLEVHRRGVSASGLCGYVSVGVVEGVKQNREALGRRTESAIGYRTVIEVSNRRHRRRWAVRFAQP
jgi:hypothetical protein